MSDNAASKTPVVAVRFPVALRDLLEDYARQHDMTTSQVIRLAVRHFVEDES